MLTLLEIIKDPIKGKITEVRTKKTNILIIN